MNEHNGPDTTVSLASAAFLHDPYPTYAWLREHAPVHHSPEWQGYVISRHADVLAALRDQRLSARRVPSGARQAPAALQEALAPALRHFARWALFADPPEHTRLRGLLNRAFVPRLIETMRPRLQALVDELLLDLLAGGGALDVIAGLAAPLPMLVIGEILGLPREDRHVLRPWSHALAAFLGARTRSVAVLEETCAAVAELERYFRAHIARRRQQPARDDLLGALLCAEESGALLSEDELVATCGLALFAGNETTADLIGNAAWMLARHPEAQDALRRDPGLTPAFVEEVLRLESPVQRTGRLAAEELVLHGTTIPAGQRVWLLVGAANRDGAQFPDPDALSLRRGDSRHLGFGFGAHFCVGAALARLEAQLAVGGLLAGLGEVRLADEPAERVDNLMVRGWKRLSLRPR